MATWPQTVLLGHLGWGPGMGPLEGPAHCLPCPPALPTGHPESGHQAFAQAVFLPDVLSLTGSAPQFLMQRTGSGGS